LPRIIGLGLACPRNRAPTQLSPSLPPTPRVRRLCFTRSGTASERSTATPGRERPPITTTPGAPQTDPRRANYPPHHQLTLAGSANTTRTARPVSHTPDEPRLRAHALDGPPTPAICHWRRMHCGTRTRQTVQAECDAVTTSPARCRILYDEGCRPEREHLWTVMCLPCGQGDNHLRRG
jgi:hypothetical protein